MSGVSLSIHKLGVRKHSKMQPAFWEKIFLDLLRGLLILVIMRLTIFVCLYVQLPFNIQMKLVFRAPEGINLKMPNPVI